jgi:hypothetical protein
MEWYNYVSAFFAGMFLANFVPHFVSGICGNPFPTPFAKPPGKGLSSPLVNVAWALLNVLIAFILFKAAHMAADDHLSLSIFFIGFAFVSLWSGKHFAGKEKERNK